MPPYPTGNAIEQLLLQQGQRRAQLAQQLGQIAAETQARNGQIWGNTLAQLGQLPAQVYAQHAAMKAQQAELGIRQAQEKRLEQELTDQQAQRNQGMVRQTAIGSAIQAVTDVGPDGLPRINRDKLQGLFAQNAGVFPLDDQEKVFKSLDTIEASGKKLQDAKLSHWADLAAEVYGDGKNVTPDSVRLGLATGKALGSVTDDDIAAINKALDQPGADPKTFLQSVMARDPAQRFKDKLTPKPVTVAPGGSLVNPETGEAVFQAPERPVSVSPGASLVRPDTGQIVTTAPESPAQLESARRLAAAQAEAARHNRVMEGQGAERIGLAGTAAAGGAAGTPAFGQGSDVHGADYLKTLPTEQQAMVKALAEGRQPWPSSFALRTPYWQDLMQKVYNYDPSFDTAQASNNARVKVRQDFTSGTSAKQVNAINTVVGHLSELSDKAEALNNSPVQFVNAVKNFVKTQAGAPEVTNFNTAKKAVADELTRVWRQAGGAESDIKSWQTSLDAANSPTQLRQAFSTIGGLLESKLQALQTQYGQGMGINDVQMISPSARKALDKLEQNSGTAPTRSAGYIYARDPQGGLHRAPAGTPLPKGWVAQ